jgi:subtilase family serine protease
VNGSLKLVAPLVAALAVAACNAGGSSNIPSTAGSSQTASSAKQFVPEWQAKHQARRACSELEHGLRCQVLLATKGITPNCSPSGGTCGWRPVDFVTRYNLSASEGNGSGQVVALIEAGDLSSAASDLSTYRSAFNLGSAPFAKYNQQGEQYNYPPSCANYGWCLETDLDIEMVAAVCPKCSIDLIEGDGTVAGLEAAESEAVTLGATILSNSWGCTSVNCGDSSFPTYFATSGIAYLASSGDSGYPEVEYPAALANVLAVGGTQLHKSGSTYSETVWDGAGAGCATHVTKPSWQHDPKCAGRTIADVSAEAGCSPAVAEYDSDYGGWVGVCGTSVASPLTAGIVALAGNAGSIVGGSTFWELSKKLHKKDFNVITSGSDGSCGDYICEAGLKKKAGGYETYSGPAGWGTPNGITAY